MTLKQARTGTWVKILRLKKNGWDQDYPPYFGVVESAFPSYARGRRGNRARVKMDHDGATWEVFLDSVFKLRKEAK